MAKVVLHTVGSRRVPHHVSTVCRAVSLWSCRSRLVAPTDAVSVTRRHKHSELFPQRLSLPETHGYVPTLSPPQVSSLLSALETRKSFSQNQNHVVKAFESNQLPSNYPTEDRRAAARLLQTDGFLFGVYDGHGGAACAQSISERLLDYITVSLLSYEDQEKYIHAMRTDAPMDLLEKYKFPGDYDSSEMTAMFRSSLQKYVMESLSLEDEEHDGDDDTTNIVRLLRSAFIRLDNDMSAEAKPASGVLCVDSLQAGLSGACGCVAHIDGADLHVANLGDTRAVIGRLDDDGDSWMPIALSTDHNVENEDEVRRIRAAHPTAEAPFILKNNRLLGSLIPLRAFGDIRFKWTAKDLQAIANSLAEPQGLILKNYYTPPYLINEPEVRQHRLTERDAFLVIASDGLWEMLDNQTVVSLVGAHLEGRMTSDRFRLDSKPANRTLGSINSDLVTRKSGLAHKSVDSNSATHLIRHALGHEHRRVSDMLTFPPEISRHFRDDITITVVYFNRDFLAKASS